MDRKYNEYYVSITHYIIGANEPIMNRSRINPDQLDKELAVGCLEIIRFLEFNKIG